MEAAPSWPSDEAARRPWRAGFRDGLVPCARRAWSANAAPWEDWKAERGDAAIAGTYEPCRVQRSRGVRGGQVPRRLRGAQRDDEPAADRDLAVRLERSPHRLSQPPRERQAKAHPPRFARAG